MSRKKKKKSKGFVPSDFGDRHMLYSTWGRRAPVPVTAETGLGGAPGLSLLKQG
jgi:hypothetical protein